VGGGWGGRWGGGGGEVGGGQRSILGGDDGPKTVPNVFIFYFTFPFRT
jgi:hypothetical protein